MKRIAYILAGIGGVFVLLAFVLLAFVISGFEREKNIDKTGKAREARWKKKQDTDPDPEEEEKEKQKPDPAPQPVHQNGTS